mmetsp:Transcript_13347/g.28231  ORF Transcript_13347/g.28231 Transcript_13347/m.28231 type:complete len:219 (-) Transcript_13347:455-1111(-)
MSSHQWQFTMIMELKFRHQTNLHGSQEIPGKCLIGIRNISNVVFRHALLFPPVNNKCSLCMFPFQTTQIGILFVIIIHDHFGRWSKHPTFRHHIPRLRSRKKPYVSMVKTLRQIALDKHRQVEDTVGFQGDAPDGVPGIVGEQRAPEDSSAGGAVAILEAVAPTALLFHCNVDDVIGDGARSLGDLEEESGGICGISVEKCVISAAADANGVIIVTIY